MIGFWTHDVRGAIILAEEFAARFDGFSIRSNDLTQALLGVDRDSEIQVFPHLKSVHNLPRKYS